MIKVIVSLSNQIFFQNDDPTCLWKIEANQVLFYFHGKKVFPRLFLIIDPSKFLLVRILQFRVYNLPTQSNNLTFSKHCKILRVLTTNYIVDELGVQFFILSLF